MLNGREMDALATGLSGSAMSLVLSLEQEFEQRLADCPTLAYRVALGVLGNAAEAEDVAQEAMLRAYRNFHRLRDRDRFRGWLVRKAWRLFFDRIRAAGRKDRCATSLAGSLSVRIPNDHAESDSPHRAIALDALAGLRAATRPPVRRA